MIGYYVHHQGAGHLARMRSIARHLSTPVTVLSSLDRPVGCDLPWLRLARDDRSVTQHGDPAAPGHGPSHDMGGGPGAAPVDPDARGTLHWVPRHDEGLRDRARQVVDWVAQARPTLVVVDVSVEVALLVRLTGTPVVLVAMPGQRDDRPHRTAYDLADGFLAALPSAAPLGDWPAERAARTDFVGAISRFDGRPAPRRADAAGRAGRRGLLLWGAGGGAPTPYDVRQLRDATPGWTWEVAGSTAQELAQDPAESLAQGRAQGLAQDPVEGPAGSTAAGWSADEVWAALGRADVVVSHAGQNVVAELAAARAPAVVVAAPRPFDEQQHTARALTEAGIAEGLPQWPEPARWPDLLGLALARGGDGWSRWSYGDGAQRAAAAIEAHVARLAPVTVSAGRSRAAGRPAPDEPGRPLRVPPQGGPRA